MALSQQLRNIANQARGAAQQQQNIGQAQVGLQTSQAMGAQANPQQRLGKQQAQQLAGAVSQANQQVQTQTQQGLQQQLGQLGQQALRQQGQAQQQSLQQQEMLSNQQIAELQRQGQLRQNSAALQQAKRLQSRELQAQQRMTSSGIQYDSELSFLTRKQREDLAELGQYTKQVLFDQRLMFRQQEDKRKFTNMRQLADFSVATAESREQLQQRLQTMQQATDKEIMALQHAHEMITSRMQAEFQRVEQQKDYAQLQALQKMRNDIKRKLQRQAAKGAAISNIIVGAATVTGAVIGGPAGAAIGYSVGQATSGGLQASGAYDNI